MGILRGNLAGLDLPDCYGSWHGGGSSPSVLGEYIRDLAVSNEYDTSTETTNAPFNPFDNSNGWVDIINIPAIDEGPITGPGAPPNNNPQVFVPNTVTANAISIKLALEVDFTSPVALWLEQQEIANNYEVLDAIAAYLNAHRERPIDPAFDNFGEHQFPTINTDAINNVVDSIYFQINNPNVSLLIDPIINPNDVPQELHFDTIEELQVFVDSLNSTNMVSETTIDPTNPNKVITRCTFPDWTFDFNVYVEQTLGDDYSVDDITSNITGFTMFVAYEQLNWTTTTVNSQANVSNVDVNSYAEVTLVVQGIGKVASFGINFNIWLNMNDGSQNTGSMTID
ncbi:MAG: hypothetical protein ED556_09845 [Winogradskyella sp.]|uniref:hypothetical protein n=1 Tax=Winogradskyella sp. TaxID=1883156 RepID=UPI000F3AC80F|nr:hypothetical protein [Winogradskyella sp.]RNC84877.1 MAG: hypothetical protein ED556_09845 [Winogradskyella sp.]